MDDNPIAALLKPVDEPEPDPISNPIAALLEPAKAYAPKVVEQFQRDRWDWNRLKSGLEEYGVNPEDYSHLKGQAAVNSARSQILSEGGKGLSFGQAYRRNFMPFRSLIGGANFLPGGLVVTAKENQEAQRKLASGDFTEEDARKAATYELHQEADQEVKRNIAPGKDYSFLNKVALEAGSLGSIGQEMAAGGALLRGAGALGRALGIGGKAGAEAAGAATSQVPAVPQIVQQSLARQALNRLPATALTPSMYVPLAQQNNIANGRDANDPTGYPSAVAYGWANMIVLGKLQAGIGKSNLVSEMAQKGIVASTELQAVDAVAGVADQFLPKAYQIKPESQRWGTVGEWLRAYRAGDKEKASEALRDATAQALTFGVFAAAHGRPEVGKDLTSQYADAIGKLRDKGLSKDEAAKSVRDLHEILSQQLDNKPYMTREDARGLLQGLTKHIRPELKDYANTLADAFAPKDRGPTALAITPKPQETLATRPPEPGHPPPPRNRQFIPNEAVTSEAIQEAIGRGDHLDRTPEGVTITPRTRSPEGPRVIKYDGTNRTQILDWMREARERGDQADFKNGILTITPRQPQPRAETVSTETKPSETPTPVLKALEGPREAKPTEPVVPPSAPTESPTTTKLGPIPSPELPEGAKSSSVIRREARRARISGMNEATKPPENPTERVLGDIVKGAGLEGRETQRAPEHIELPDNKAFYRNLDFGDREITIVYNPERNAIDLGYSNKESVTFDMRDVPEHLRRGTIDLLRAVESIARSAHRQRVNVEYAAESKRHALYSKSLQKAGFELQSKGETDEFGYTSYIWAPTKEPSIKPKAGAKPSPAPPQRKIEAPPPRPEPRVETVSTPTPPPVTPKVQVGAVKADPVRKAVNTALKTVEGLPHDSPARRGLEAALDNLDVTGPAKANHGIDPDLSARRFASEALHLDRSNAPESEKAVFNKVMDALGMTRVGGEAGQTVPFDPNLQRQVGEGPGIPPGSPVKVVASGWKRTSDNYMPARAEVETVSTPKPPTPEAKAPEAPPEPKPDTAERDRLQELWNSLTKAQRREVPAIGDHLESLGGDRNTNPFSNRFASDQEKVEVPVPEQMTANIDKANLSDGTREDLKEYLAGKSFADIAAKRNVTEQAVTKRLNLGFEKLKDTQATEWVEYDRLEDAKNANIAELRKSANAERRSQTVQSAVEDAQQNEEAHQAAQDGFFAGIPYRLDFLSSLFGKPQAGGKTVGEKFSDWFYGTLSEAARQLKGQKDRDLASLLFDMDNNVKDARAAMEKAGIPYEKLSQQQIDRINAHLSEQTPGLLYGFPKPVADALNAWRDHVDLMSQKLIDVGAIPEKLKPVILANKGAYLTRTYKIFDPKQSDAWVERIRSGQEMEVVNKLTDLLTRQFVDANKGAKPTAEWLEGELRKYLGDAKTAESPLGWLKRGRLGSKDLTILEHRNEDLPPELRAFWGEEKDPMTGYVNSIAKMSHLLANQQFLNRVETVSSGKWLFDSPEQAVKAGFNNDRRELVQFAEPTDSALAPLNGKWTSKEVLQSFRDAYAPETLNSAMRGYMKVVSLAKASKIIVSPVGIARNFFSNVGIAIRNGWWRAGHFPDAMKQIMDDTPTGRATYRDMIVKGIVNEGLTYHDFRKSLTDAWGDKADLDAIRSGERPALESMVARTVKQLTKPFARAYKAGDEIWRVYGYLNEKARYEQAGFTKEEADAKAVDVVRNTFPTYSEAPEGVQKLRRFPFAGPFPTFAAEMIRTTKNGLKLAWEEATGNDPRTRAIGYTRLAGFASAFTLPAAAALLMRNITGVTDDQEKAFRRTLPEYQKHSTLGFVNKNDKNQLSYVDLSRFDPHAQIADAIGAAIGTGLNEGVRKGILDGLDEAARPFISEELLLRPIVDVMRNKKEPGGAVYNENDQPFHMAKKAPEDVSMLQRVAGGKVPDIATHLASPFVPGGFTAARRAVKALAGSNEQRTGEEYSVPLTLQEQVTGARVQLNMPDQWFPKAVTKADKDMADAFGTAVNTLVKAKGSVTDQELSDAFDKSEERRHKIWDEVVKDAQAAQMLGLSRPQVLKMLKEGGFNQREASAILEGRYLPHSPQLTGQGTARERAAFVRRQAALSGRPKPPG